MVKRLFFLCFLAAGFFARAQQLKVEFDKNRDLSRYKTFTFGDGEITTPKDLRLVPDATIHGWIRKSITEELTKKGLTKVDAGGDLVISYVTGTEKRSDAGNVGPLGLTPGANTTQTYMRDYQLQSLVIDLNDLRNNTLLWRVSAAADTNLPEAERNIDQIVERGFKKFSLKPKKEKKKK